MAKKLWASKLRWVIPVVGLATAGIISGVVFASPLRDQIFVNQSAIYAGYDQNFQVPIYKNSYSDYVPARDSLQIIASPDFSKKQSYQLAPKTDYLVSLNKNQQVSLLKNQAQTTDVLKLEFSRAQLIKSFQNRYNPQLAIKFGFSVSAFDSNSNKQVERQFENRILGFSLSDLAGVKTNHYNVFSYNVNDDYPNMSGLINGKLITKLSKQGNLTITLQVTKNAFRDIHQTADKNFKYQFNFKSDQSSVFTLWDINRTNDMSSWFWPNPDGPKQNSEIRTPLISSKAIGVNGNYSLTKKSGPNSDGTFSTPYQKVNNKSELSQTGKSTTESNLFLIEFRSDQWQQALFNDFNGELPKNPGLQIKFDLFYSLFDPSYQVFQDYNVPLYGYFNLGDLQAGRSINQTITNYNLEEGRSDVSGKFSLNLAASMNLKKDLVITISAKSDNLKVLKSSVSNFKDNQLTTKYQLGNLELFSFPTDGVNTIKTNQLGPRTTFNFDLSNANFQINSPKIDLEKDYYNKNNGKEHHWLSWQPYLRDYKTVWSSYRTLNIQNYVENNQSYAQKSNLAFAFAGTPQVNNLLEIRTSNRGSNINQLKVYNPGFDSQKKKLAQQVVVTRNNSSSADAFNTFKININQLSTSPAIYQWRKMYTYLNTNKSKDFSAWDSTIFTFINPGLYRKTIKSMIRVVYQIELGLVKKNDYFNIKYRIGVASSTYQWNWKKNNEASKGNAGFKINNITLNIKTD